MFCASVWFGFMSASIERKCVLLSAHWDQKPWITQTIPSYVSFHIHFYELALLSLSWAAMHKWATRVSRQITTSKDHIAHSPPPPPLSNHGRRQEEEDSQEEGISISQGSRIKAEH